MDLRTIPAEFDLWSVKDRIRLIEAVSEGHDDYPEAIRLTPAREQDLENRTEAARANPKAGSPWKEVKNRLISS